MTTLVHLRWQTVPEALAGHAEPDRAPRYRLWLSCVWRGEIICLFCLLTEMARSAEFSIRHI